MKIFSFMYNRRNENKQKNLCQGKLFHHYMKRKRYADDFSY
jgi:hypothetical protein